MGKNFLSQNIFRDSEKICRYLYVGWELEKEKSESVKENENKEFINVDEFQEHILQQKLA